LADRSFCECVFASSPARGSPSTRMTASEMLPFNPYFPGSLFPLLSQFSIPLWLSVKSSPALACLLWSSRTTVLGKASRLLKVLKQIQQSGLFVGYPLRPRLACYLHPPIPDSDPSYGCRFLFPLSTSFFYRRNLEPSTPSSFCANFHIRSLTSYLIAGPISLYFSTRKLLFFPP